MRHKIAPDVDQVREWSWWWNFPTNGKPHVLQLDVQGDEIVHADSNASAPFDPNDWPGEWAPCVPPPSEAPVAHRIVLEMVDGTPRGLRCACGYVPVPDDFYRDRDELMSIHIALHT